MSSIGFAQPLVGKKRGTPVPAPERARHEDSGVVELLHQSTSLVLFKIKGK